MARTKAPLIFASFVTSGIAAVLSFVALGTQQWVVANVDLNIESVYTANNKVQYGLFFGSYNRTVGNPLTYDLTITCDFGKNKCAVLCGDFDTRQEYLQNLFRFDERDGYRECTPVRSLRGSTMDHTYKSSLKADDDSVPDGFLVCGVWFSTIIFLLISSLFGIISTLLALWNTVANPVETFISILGLFVYNCIACACSLIVVILWGVLFAVTVKDNVAIYDTIIMSGNNEGKAWLGYSYWLNLVVFILFGASAGILLLREYLINKEPDNVVNLEDKNDTTIILF